MLFFLLSYDIDKTANYLNEFYCVNNVNKPVNKFDFTKKPLNGLKNGTTGSNETVDYYSNNLNMMYNNDDDENGRNSAKRYFNLRQEYFEKASEAYKRGWGSVAGYYAQMVSPYYKKITTIHIFITTVSIIFCSLRVINWPLEWICPIKAPR